MNDQQQKNYYPRSIKASDIMSEVVVTISEDTLLRDATHLMLRDRVSGLPVTDKDKNVVGMLTLTDLFTLVDQAIAENNYDFYKKLCHEKDLKISHVMSKNVFVISPETTLDSIVRVALTKRIHTFPVVENNKIIGVIGKHDILNALFSF